MCKKIHKRALRLRNNAGMDFPVCAASAELLDLDKAHWPTTGDKDTVTCKRCLQIMAKNRWA
jgi:hypothetical protein